MSKRFFHYCCRHSVNGILDAKGTLVPNPHPGRQTVTEARAKAWGLGDEFVWVYPVVWVTDVDVMSRDDAMLVGLGQVGGDLTDCFRVEFRFIVPNVGLQPWTEWADANVGPELAKHRQALETCYGADPSHWWVSDKALTGCRIDQGYHATPQRGWGAI
jgi:hypothetical protein